MNRDIYVGKTPDGELMTVEIEVKNLPRPVTSVEHKLVTDGWRLSITGALWDPEDMSDMVADGQIMDDLLRIEPSERWTREDLDRLHDIWQRWHLNDLRAACAHMELPEDTNFEVRRHILCNLDEEDLPDGQERYQYGRAWLYEPLPGDVLTDVRRFQRRLNAPGYRLSDGLKS